MSRRYHPTGTNPMSENRRWQVHGRLIPMERPEGEPSLLVGTLTFLGGLLAIALFVAVFSPVSAFQEKPICSEYCK